MFGEREFNFRDVLRVLEHVWLLKNTVRGNAADQASKLQGSGGDGALADGHGDGLAGIPFAVEDPLDPGFGRHKARFFGWKIDAGLMADAHFIAVVSQAVDAELHANGIKEDVAGFQNGFVQVSASVRGRAFFGGIDPALELASIKSAVAGAVSGEAFRDAVVLEHRSGSDNFVDGAGRELRLDGAIEKRVQGIFIELPPLFFRNAHREIVGIGSRAADHGQHFAGAWIEGDDRSGPRAKRLLRDLLQVVINGQLNLLAGNGLLLGEAHILHFLADAVDDHTAHAVGAH